MNNKLQSFVYLFCFFLALLFIISCKKEEKIEPITEAVVVNSKPLLFEVYVHEVTSNHAIINWGPVYDLENDPLYHKVYLNGSAITDVIFTDGLLKIENLVPETTYNGKIYVTDSISEPISVNFSFTTTKKFIRFNRIIERFNGNAIHQTEDEGFIIVGTTNLHKLDSLGFEQWNRQYRSTGDPYSLYVPVILPIDDGFLISNSGSITKLDHKGNTLWQHITENSNTLLYQGVQKTVDNHIIALGIAKDRTHTGTISKFSNEGDLIWEHYIDVGQNTLAEYITNTHDGNFVIICTSSQADFLIVKINEQGEILWSKNYGNKRLNYDNKIKITKDNGFIICAESFDSNDLYNRVLGRILKIDPEGKLEWEKFYPSVINIAQTIDGEYIFTGSEGLYSRVAILGKLSDQGDLIWRKEFKPDYMDYIWEGSDLKQTIDGGIVLLGFKSWVWSGSGKESGMWVLKTDDVGN